MRANEFSPLWCYRRILNMGDRKLSDDLKNRGAQDPVRININEEHEVRYWTQALGLGREELERAVKAVGVLAADVRKHLGK